MKKNKNIIIPSILKLDKWINNNGWAGYDPYDVKGIDLSMKLIRNKYTAIPTDKILTDYPHIARKFFNIQPVINTKAMALFARGYLSLYKTQKDEKYLENGKYCLNWLKENYSKDYSGLCWGYPFDWQSRIFIPKHTPSGVVSSIAGHAFLDYYEYFKEKEYLDSAESVCNFITKDLNIDEVSDEEICFSYTPIDNFHVHNANLFSASVLLRTSQYLQNETFRSMGIKAMNYTARKQNDDGTWYYWGPTDEQLFIIDNYHTGFVLECLNYCRRSLNNDFLYKDGIKSGLEHYAKHFIQEDGVPKMTPDSIHPIDIHSCAQSIITFCELSDFDNRFLDVSERVAEWSIDNMQDKDGFFYFRIYKNNKIDKTPYIRWGQGWMLLALARLMEVHNE